MMKFQNIITPPRSNYRKQCGQVLVLYALMIPLFFLFAGVGLDLGWYYLNVSRLQNAADASVLVGAKSLLNKLQSDSATKTKYAGYRVILVDKYPSDNPYTGTDIDITTSAVEAKKYAIKNLSSDSVGYAPQFFSVAEAASTATHTLQDNWSKGGDPTITMNAKLYQDSDTLYYVVTLEEDIQHFFMPGWFEEMNAPVVAVAKLSKDSTGRKIIFDANGGHLEKIGGSDKTTRVTIYVDELLKTQNKIYEAVPYGTPERYSDTPKREGYDIFRYWTDKPENGRIIPPAQKLTNDNVDDFFATYDTDNDGTIVLYAQWTKTNKPPLVLNFDTNGGAFYNGDKTDSKNIKHINEMEDDETTDPIKANKGTPERDGYEFKGWSTDSKADANSLLSNYIQDGKQLTKTEISALFGNKTSVTLYAVWKSTEEIKPHNNKTLWEQMEYLIAKNVDNFYWQAAKQKYNNTDPVGDAFINSAKWTSNNEVIYYTESITLSDGHKTKDGGKLLSDITKYYIDFYQTSDSRFQPLPDNVTYDVYGNDARAHALFNVNTTYNCRNEYDDPLYFRIESEPYYFEPTPIRQIIININADNTADGKRPLFFFYDGPSETAGGKLNPSLAQPVILNLNADFKGVLFMPDIPVVINGNGHKFLGFIIAKEYRYLDTTQGAQVRYSTTGATDKDYRKTTTASNIRVNTTNAKPTIPSNGQKVTAARKGDVYTKKVNVSTALGLWDYRNYFGLSADSEFRKFKIESNVNFMYVFYGYNASNGKIPMEEAPFHEYYDTDKPLIPLYKLDEDRNQILVTNWDDVKLFGKPRFFGADGKLRLYDAIDIKTELQESDREPISKELSNESKNKGYVRLDSNLNPSPLYDEAGNPVYFCDDYVKMTGTYTVLTLDRVDDGTRKPQEFLLTADTANISADTNVSNTDDWK